MPLSQEMIQEMNSLTGTQAPVKPLVQQQQQAVAPPTESWDDYMAKVKLKKRQAAEEAAKNAPGPFQRIYEGTKESLIAPQIREKGIGGTLMSPIESTAQEADFMLGKIAKVPGDMAQSFQEHIQKPSTAAGAEFRDLQTGIDSATGKPLSENEKQAMLNSAIWDWAHSLLGIPFTIGAGLKEVPGVGQVLNEIGGGLEGAKEKMASGAVTVLQNMGIQPSPVEQESYKKAIGAIVDYAALRGGEKLAPKIPEVLGKGKEIVGKGLEKTGEVIGSVKGLFKKTPEPPQAPPQEPPTLLERAEKMVPKTPEELLQQKGISPTEPFKATVEKTAPRVKEMYQDAKKHYKEASDAFIQENPGTSYDLSSKAYEMKNIFSGEDATGNSFGLDLKQLKNKQGAFINKFEVIPKKGVPNRFGVREMRNIQSLMEDLTSKNMKEVTPEGLPAYGQMIRKYYDAVPEGSAGPTAYHALVMKLAEKGDQIAESLMPDTLKAANQEYINFHKVREAFGSKLIDPEGNLRVGAESFLSKIPSQLKGVARDKIMEAQKLLGVDLIKETGDISKNISSAKAEPKIIREIEKGKEATRGEIQKTEEMAKREYEKLIKENAGKAKKMAEAQKRWSSKWKKIIGVGALSTIATAFGIPYSAPVGAAIIGDIVARGK